MACNSCETNFQVSQTIVVSIVKSGGNALLYVQNQGRNIVLLRRILLCFVEPTGATVTWYLRPPPSAITWLYPQGFLEPNILALFYFFTPPVGSIVQAQAEYVELEGRSRSCSTTF